MTGMSKTAHDDIGIVKIKEIGEKVSSVHLGSNKTFKFTYQYLIDGVDDDHILIHFLLDPHRSVCLILESKTNNNLVLINY